VNEFTAGPEGYIPQAMIITLQLYQDLVSFVFIGGNPDSTKTGINPFIIAYGTKAQQEAPAIKNTRAFALLTGGAACIELKDLEALKTNDTKHIPTTCFKLEVCMGLFRN